MTMRTCECRIFYSLMTCSFLQLMSKDGMSAFGADLSGDQEPQVSATEKETNWHFGLLNTLLGDLESWCKIHDAKGHQGLKNAL